MLTKDYPDHHDAELVIKLYELRRDAVMRESRRLINAEFWPRTFDDVLAFTKGDHPLNPAFRQVSSYWEMVYGMVKHGVLHADFMMESCGEGMFVFAKVEPYLAEYRAKISPIAFRNAEWMTAHSPAAQAVLELFRKRVATTLAAKA
ncbi:MAG: hypothetical protein IT361_16600 [Gemmatimonadaceae bacterium]|nr:hypothetical protein [Gemmatimonadaceae bacterium]